MRAFLAEMIHRSRNRVDAVFDRWFGRWRKPLSRAVHWVIPLALLVYLGHGLARIGWLQVWDARPRDLGFYLVLFLPFFVQPSADLTIYRRLWGVGSALPLTVLLRKRYLNNVMLEYSGEAYFCLWVDRNLKIGRAAMLHAVKDSNVLSAGAGLVMVWMILLGLTACGDLRLPAAISANLWAYGGIASVPLALSLALLAGGRRVTSLTRRQIVSTFSIHLSRSAFALSLEFLLWWLSGALPDAAICLEFVGLRLLVTRLPLVPRKDLLFVGVGMAAAGLMALSAPRVAAVLVIMTGFDQALEFVLVGLPWLFETTRFKRGIGETPA